MTNGSTLFRCELSYAGVHQNRADRVVDDWRENKSQVNQDWDNEERQMGSERKNGFH
jgi:hypothetical protein